jgi:hypothetical protein
MGSLAEIRLLAGLEGEGPIYVSCSKGKSGSCSSQEFDAAGRELWLKGRPAARFNLRSAGHSIPLKSARNQQK